MECRTSLLQRGIKPEAYNSKNIAHDLDALRTELGYNRWKVLGASYGTYVAQVYASLFPSKVSHLILDSPIADIDSYFSKNTTGFMTSLEEVFVRCKSDPNCNEAFPDLESVFYKTIASLDKNPLSITVQNGKLDSETFTYNGQDFKVVLHQSLYYSRLVEVMPLLIYQFYERNEGPLAALLEAFSGAINLDYGVYYCMICNEVLP